MITPHTYMHAAMIDVLIDQLARGNPKDGRLTCGGARIAIVHDVFPNVGPTLVGFVSGPPENAEAAFYPDGELRPDGGVQLHAAQVVIAGGALFPPIRLPEADRDDILRVLGHPSRHDDQGEPDE